MLLETAAIECMQCYHLSIKASCDESRRHERKLGAAKALDSVLFGAKLPAETHADEDLDITKKAQEGLDACLDCDYSSPRISNIVRNYLNTKNKSSTANS